MVVELDLDSAGGVREIPEHERARGVRGFGERAHVMALAGSEVHLGQQEQRGVAVERVAQPGAIDRADLTPEQLGDATGDVEIGWEVAPLGHDHTALRSCSQHRGHQPEQPHRRRVGDQHLTR